MQEVTYLGGVYNDMYQHFASTIDHFDYYPSRHANANSRMTSNTNKLRLICVDFSFCCVDIKPSKVSLIHNMLVDTKASFYALLSTSSSLRTPCIAALIWVAKLTEHML